MQMIMATRSQTWGHVAASPGTGRRRLFRKPSPVIRLASFVSSIRGWMESEKRSKNVVHSRDYRFGVCHEMVFDFFIQES